MSRLGYVKYNRTRAPQFQTKTEIIYDLNVKKVIKTALYDEGKKHIQAFENNYKKLEELYQYVKPIRVEYRDEKAIFKYVEGVSVAEQIEKSFNTNEDVLSVIQSYIDILFCYNDVEIIDFRQTQDFRKVFGEYDDTVKALRFANVDEIFDNFIICDDAIYLLDYEWTFDFPVPIDFMRFRALYYFYIKNDVFFSDKLSLGEYMKYFGFDENEIDQWIKLDDRFQQYVHGEKRKYIYTSRYMKKTKNINTFLNENRDIINQMSQLHERLAEKEKLILLKDSNIDDFRNNEKVLNGIIDDLRENEKLLNSIIDDLRNNEKVLNGIIDDLRENEKHLYQKISELSGMVANQNDYIEFLRRCMRNPFFAFTQVMKKLLKKILPEVVQVGLYCLYSEGLEVFIYKLKNYRKSKNPYEQWLKQNEKDVFLAETLEYNPLISVVVPVYNVERQQLVECIESVINQTYTNWELCLVDDFSTMESVQETLKEYEGIESIKIVYRTENGHISRATNSGIEIATGEYIALMDCDDLLAPNALYEMAKKLNEDKTYDFVYSDEDKITEDGKIRKDPFFKPDWSPDTFMSLMYTCHFSMFRKTLVDELGGLRIGLEGSQDYDLVLRVMEKTNRIGHVPKILYHWRERKESTANSMTAKPYIIESTKKAKLDALERRGYKGYLECIESITQFRVVYEPQNNPKVSIIIPSKDNYSVLEKCICSIKQITKYINYEIIVVDNGSNADNKNNYTRLCEQYQCAYVYEPMDFNFSKMCNIGVSHANGDYYLFLNDDIEVQGEEWLGRLLGQAQVKYVGAVGCKLLYPNSNLIQHVGVLNLPIGPGHAFHKFDDDMNYYYGRNLLDYNFSIVTAACLMIAKEKFNQIGGFDEILPVAYNDVALCFKLIEQGYYNVLRNDVILVHHESISRGYDNVTSEKIERQKKEMQRLYDLHPMFKDGYDPCYNPNLVKDRGDFSFDLSKENILRLFKLQNDNVTISDAIECHLDEIVVSDTIKIVGWAFDKRKRKAKKVQIVLVGKNGQQYVVDTDSVYRPDVRDMFRVKSIAFAGFQVVAKFDIVEKDIYDMYLKIGAKYIEIQKQLEL